MRTRAIGLSALVASGLALTLPPLATSWNRPEAPGARSRRAGVEPREITLVAREMAFYVDGDVSPNPMIRLKAGETVRIVLKNRDDGLFHDFAIDRLGVATGKVRAGEAASVVVDVPHRPGNYPYACRPHSRMMNGTAVVEAR